jgi:uncharacterized membrane protein
MSLFEALFKYPVQAFREGELVFVGPVRGQWLLLVPMAMLVLSWALYYQVKGRVPGRQRWVLPVIRCLALAAMVFLLADPALRAKAAPDQEKFAAVLVDTSRSMSIQDAGTADRPASRIEAARRLLGGEQKEAGLLREIARHTKVILYRFDQSGAREGEPSDLKADGPFTNIFRSVRDVDGELQGLPLAAVVMITDGCRNTGGSCEDAARLIAGRGAPLYTVGLGKTNPPKDFEVLRVFAPRRVWRNTEVDAYATIRHTDFREPFEVRVCRGQNVLLAQKIDPGDQTDLKRVRLTFTPDHEQGAAAYRVSIPPAEGEKVTDNNFKDFVLEIQDDRLPVLYVEGSPRLEYRFLRRAMFGDRDFRLVGLLRLASDRFYIQGSNQTEGFLQQGFPTTREQLFAFKAVILGDIEAGYFSPQQMEMLEEFVKVRGGGLLMLGGVNSLGLGKYAGTAVGGMLPLIISEADGKYSDQEFTAQPTQEGLDHTLMRLDLDAETNRRMWEQMPPLIGITPVKGVKKGATLLLRQKADDGGRAVLAVQNYGQGGGGAFTSGGSWYWQMSKPASDEFHGKFWKQMIRWLVVGAQERLTLKTDADVYARKDSVILQATVRQKDLRPVNDAAVIATVTDPLGNSEEIPMHWTLWEDGAYQCRYRAEEEGAHKVSVRVDGWDVKRVETGFEVSEPFAEFTNAGLKEATLREMAAITGGRYFSYDEAGGIPQEIKRAVEKLQLMRGRCVDRELWDAPAAWALLVVLFGVEWLVRRRSGLA